MISFSFVLCQNTCMLHLTSEIWIETSGWEGKEEGELWKKLEDTMPTKKVLFKNKKQGR